MGASESSNTVHIWRALLNQPQLRIDRLARLLSEDEQQRAARFYRERLKSDFIIARGLLRMILSQYTGIHPNQLQFSYGAHGKPALSAECGGECLRFNLAHSNGLAIYAVTHGRELGIDVEKVRPLSDAEQIAARFFSAHEYAALRSLPSDCKLEGFYNCWTRKEAYLKAKGSGLTVPLDQFDVTLAPNESARLLRVQGDPEASQRWSLRTVNLLPGYVGALVVEGHDWHMWHCDATDMHAATS